MSILKAILTHPKSSFAVGTAIIGGALFGSTMYDYNLGSPLQRRSIGSDSPDQMKGIAGPAAHDFIKGTLGDNLLLNAGLGMGLELVSHKLSNTSMSALKAIGMQHNPGLTTSILNGGKRSMFGNLFKSRTADREIGNVLRYIAKNPGVVESVGAGKAAFGLKTASKLRGFAKGVGWLGIGMVAFDAITSMVDLPAPVRQIIQPKTTTLGGTYYDSREAYTQRRRALEAIHNSQYGGRSAFGNEASIMHQ